jgi:hypothetical protein
MQEQVCFILNTTNPSKLISQSGTLRLIKEGGGYGTFH